MENIKSTITWLAPPYAMLITSLYLYGYWSTFDINLFEYTTISEIILVALFPSLLAFTASMIGFATAARSYSVSPPEDHKKRRPSILMQLAFLLGLILPVCWLTDSYWLLLFAILIPAIPFLTSLPILYSLQNSQLSGLIVILLTVVPVGTFISAKEASRSITRGTQYWATAIDGIEFRYVGHVGNKTFFTNAANDTILILPDSENSLALTKVKTSKILDSRKKWLKELFN